MQSNHKILRSKAPKSVGWVCLTRANFIQILQRTRIAFQVLTVMQTSCKSGCHLRVETKNLPLCWTSVAMSRKWHWWLIKEHPEPSIYSRTNFSGFVFSQARLDKDTTLERSFSVINCISSKYLLDMVRVSKSTRCWVMSAAMCCVSEILNGSSDKRFWLIIQAPETTTEKYCCPVGWSNVSTFCINVFSWWFQNKREVLLSMCETMPCVIKAKPACSFNLDQRTRKVEHRNWRKILGAFYSR